MALFLKSGIIAGQTLNLGPVLTQTCVSLNEVDQAVFIVLNMEIRENDVKISLFL